ncbi:MAG: RluA family pseudouridine synthase [Leptospirales bacterium]|nr:RluA family pseudouridine synthase [Leptospirales bacterium]
MNIADRIIYEDNHLLVIDKPAGILSQADGTRRDDVLTLCKAYIKQKYAKPGEVFLGLVHRLDFDVSGVMVLARTSKAASRLSEQFRDRSVKKFYEAILEGRIEPSAGRLEILMRKDEGKRMARQAEEDDHDAKPASLTYRTLRRDGQRTLIEIQLESGRFHQIRFQFSENGHPIVGDTKYGARPSKHGLALRAVRLVLEHPTLKESMTFETGEAWESALW